MRNLIKYNREDVRQLENNFQSFLEGTIHDSNHLQTVFERLEYVSILKNAVENLNAEKAKEAIENFYRYIKYDHENYVPPQDLLAAAIGRTHFFHGIIYTALLDRLAPSVFAYSLSLVFIETINLMDDPDEALDLTCSVIDTYCDYCKSSERIQTSEFSSQVLTLIDLNLNNELSTQILADYLHLHPDYLQKKFKKETGKNITDMINERRIELAKIYLRSSKYSVTDIAYEVGFSDASYFGKVFKKFEGLTPLKFRKQFKR